LFQSSKLSYRSGGWRCIVEERIVAAHHEQAMLSYGALNNYNLPVGGPLDLAQSQPGKG